MNLGLENVKMGLLNYEQPLILHLPDKYSMSKTPSDYSVFMDRGNFYWGVW